MDKVLIYEVTCPACQRVIKIQQDAQTVMCACQKVISQVKAEPSEPKLHCPSMSSDYRCQLIGDLAGVDYHPELRVCSLCKAETSRVNTYTIQIAQSLNPSLELNLDMLGHGFGSKLESIFGMLFRKSTGCRCDDHQAILDLWTPEYVEQNLSTVIDWLQEESANRGIPFSRFWMEKLLKQLLSQHKRRVSPDLES